MMKKKRLIYKLVSAAAVFALLASSFGISASAAVIDENEPDPPVKSVKLKTKGGEALGASDLPSYYSSRDLGYVSSVKDQETQDCWVYGALGTFESLMLKNNTYTGDMSVYHANIWGTTREGNKGWLRGFYDAGRAKIMPGYFTSWQGAVEQSKTPELFPGGVVTADNLPTDLADYGITSLRYLYREDPDSIKRAIMESGGISTYYSSASDCLASDDTSYYMPPDYNSGTSMGHAIELVGWDDNYDASKFKTAPEGNGAWLAKNSWGEHRGDGGFFWISYYDKELFSYKKFKPTYQLKSFEKITVGKKLLQNEIFGATWKFDYTKSKNMTIFESFEFDSEYPVLDKVIFETELQGARYYVYYVPDKSDGTPDPDESKWTELYSSTTEYAGYICADFEDFDIPDSSGNIALRMDSSALGENANFGVCEWLSAGGVYTFMNDSKPGQSYILYNGKIIDTLDYYETYQKDNLGGTFVVKALTKKQPLMGDVDQNGIVDINDATLLQRHIAMLVELDDDALAVADMNSDGYFTISDVTLIQRLVAGFET